MDQLVSIHNTLILCSFTSLQTEMTVHNNVWQHITHFQQPLLSMFVFITQQFALKIVFKNVIYGNYFALSLNYCHVN